MSGIFISYRHEGGFETARLLAMSLERDGYSVFFDKSSEKGVNFNEKIEVEITKCSDFIVILDKDVFKRTTSGEKREYDGLRHELSLAIKRHKKIIRVELPSFVMPDELPEDINEIREYDHIKYPAEDDFDNFDTFYNKLIPSLNTHSPKKIFKSLLPFLFLLFLVFIGTGLWYLWDTNNELDTNKEELKSIKQETVKYKHDLDSIMQQPTLLLVGAGTVRGALEKKAHISTSKEWVYLPISTGAALPIISKEIDVKQNIGNDKLRQYNLVLFSAMNAKDSDIIPDSITRVNFINNIGRVIGVKVGSNNLQIVLKNDGYFDDYINNDSLITTNELARIVQDKTVTVFTTSNNHGNRGISGTFKRYAEILHSLHHVTLEKMHCKEFNLNQVYSYFNNNSKNHFVVLETTTFTVDSTDTSNHWLTLPLYDSAKQSILQNDLYIYFIARKNPEGTIEKYYVPEQVRQFLTCIGCTLPADNALQFEDEKHLIQEYSIDGKIIQHNP